MSKQTPKSRLSRRNKPIVPVRPDVDDFDPLYPADAAADGYVAGTLRGLSPARETLPKIALAEALGPAGVRRLKDRSGIAVVIEVPGPDWIPHIEIALKEICDWANVTCRSGAQRSLDKTSEGNDKIARLLSEGARVAGISQSPSRYLPATLLASADLYVRVGPPSNRSISQVIRQATGKRPRRLPRGIAAALDFDTTTASIRFGGTAGDAIRRLQAATAAQSGADGMLKDVPPLEQLHGFGDAMTWSQNLVRDLDAWRDGKLDWQSISRACLWASEPGLGKTTLVRALAKAARVPLVASSLGDLFANSDGYLGGVLRAAEQSFQRAVAQGPSILFWDEIDSIPDRNSLDNRAKEWWTPLVNFYLTSIDQCLNSGSSRVIIIGATNNPRSLDAALIRPGRLHPVVRIPRPDATALAGIFRSHLKEDLTEDDLTGLADLAVGASGADIVGWVRQARSSARAGARRMILSDLVQAVAPADGRSEEESRVVAHHEASHAAAALFYDVGTLQSVSIAPNRSSAGMTRASLHPRGMLTREQTEAIVIVTLAGRAMDAVGGAANSGAGGGSDSDLARATAVLAQMHASHGLGESLLFRGGPDDIARALASDANLRQVVERDLQRLYAVACGFVRENRSGIVEVAERLIAERVLPGRVVEEIMRAHRRPSRPVLKGGQDAR